MYFQRKAKPWNSATLISALVGPWTKITYYALFRFTATNCGKHTVALYRGLLLLQNTKNNVGSVTQTWLGSASAMLLLPTAVNLRTHTHTSIKQTYFFLFWSKSTFNTNHHYYGILNTPSVTRTMRSSIQRASQHQQEDKQAGQH
jgi:hypothetical protein